MWILESEGDFLQGKSIWLKPGKKYLFGRPSKEAVQHVINDKTISRKHLVIEVSPVTPGDGSRIHTRSKVTVTDLDCRHGTQLDGEQIRGESKNLTKNDHVIKLGKYEHVLRVTWNPVLLCFSPSTKERAGNDPLASVRARLEDLDMKVVEPYIVGKTTHVIQAKRNTAKGLQALINAKYIVQDSYVDSLVYAATPDDLDEPENLSPLEKHFDGSWPDPVPHLPPPGKEPNPRPATSFAPNPDRLTVFEGYTFIFLDKAQLDNLQDAVNNGHGKALLYQIKNGETTADEIVRYMRSVADEKGFGDIRDATDRGGVVLVRFRAKGDFEQWSIDLSNEVAIQLDQRTIDQSEFLDAILQNDAGPLRRAVPVESREGLVAPPPTAASIDMTIKPAMSSPPPQENSDRRAQESQPSPKRPRKRTAVVSRFKQFDDGFDMDSIPSYTLQEDGGSEMVSQESNGREASAASSADSVGNWQIQNNQARNPRKRSLHPDADNEDQMVDDLLPAATAMKRRQMEIEKEKKRRGIVDKPAQNKSQKGKEERARKSKRQKTEIDVMEIARERREAQEDAAKRDKENLDGALEGMDLEQMKNLAVVEEMEVPVRTTRLARNGVDREASDRWDERWNGRKNFKKFRRQGDGTTQRHRLQTVIVPLEEVKKKDFGIGDEYWADSDRRKTKRRERERNGEQPTQTQEPSNHPASSPLEEEAAEIVGSIDVDEPRTTRLADKTNQSQQAMNQSQSLRKRPASGSAGKEVPAKKRRGRAEQGSDSESDDGMRFQFKGRNR